jgi:hypothetical protein
MPLILLPIVAALVVKFFWLLAAVVGRVLAVRLIGVAGRMDDAASRGAMRSYAMVVRLTARRPCPDGSMIRLLLDHGADPKRGEGNNTPLELARMIAGFPRELIDLMAQKAELLWFRCGRCAVGRA